MIKFLPYVKDFTKWSKFYIKKVFITKHLVDINTLFLCKNSCYVIISFENNGTFFFVKKTHTVAETDLFFYFILCSYFCIIYKILSHFKMLESNLFDHKDKNKI